jgi:hypothetical protein
MSGLQKPFLSRRAEETPRAATRAGFVVVLGTGWIAYTVAGLLHRFGPRLAMLLAGRRLMDNPWNGSRTLAAVLAGVFVGTRSRRLGFSWRSPTASWPAGGRTRR